MKYLHFNRKSLLFATLLASSFGLNAQIQSTHTDEKFGYTTVVYKDKAATDKDVLSALDNSVGMGDVVRVTVAPPKPAAVPTVDKTKGEDVWLKPKTPVNTLTAATAAKVMAPAAAPGKRIAAAPNATPAAPKPAPVAAKPLVNKVAPAPTPVVVQEQTKMAESNIAASPRTVTSKTSVASKTSKSANKSLKKGGKKGGSYKMKNRKKGKQRYGCPKF